MSLDNSSSPIAMNELHFFSSGSLQCDTVVDDCSVYNFLLNNINLVSKEVNSHF